jgi:hypothetical protein
MDVLNVRLGPVLPYWPAGLVLRCSLQGDVIGEAQGELVDGSPHEDPEDTGPARRMDNIASVLALAGWEAAAANARRIRDAALETGNEPGGVPLTRLSRKVRRSWLLRWSLRGLRSLSEEEVHQRGLPAEAVGDTYDRLLGMLERAVAGASTDLGATYSAHHVADLVSGLDLATARLVVASLDIQGLRTEHAEHVEHGASRG